MNKATFFSVHWMKLKESELLKKIKERLPISNMAKPFNQLYLQTNIKKMYRPLYLTLELWCSMLFLKFPFLKDKSGKTKIQWLRFVLKHSQLFPLFMNYSSCLWNWKSPWCPLWSLNNSTWKNRRVFLHIFEHHTESLIPLDHKYLYYMPIK